jgi:diguanylate cyclase (GGDEF)-like protein/PAS domain S-box-containing protein
MARTALDGFTGAALRVDSQGHIFGLNDQGSALMATLSDAALTEINAAGSRAVNAGSVRLERLNGPFPGESSDAVVLPLDQGGGAMVLIATNPAESAMRRALIESRQRYRDLVEISNDFIWETDRHGRFVFMSGAGALGYSTRDMLGRLSSDFVVDASPLPFSVFQAREAVVQTDVWLHRADGLISCQAITAVPIFDSDGAWSGTRGTARDVTDQRAAERGERLRLLRDRLMTYLANTLDKEIDPEKALPTALSGIGLVIGATGGLIVSGAPDSAGYDVLDWGEPLAAADFSEIRNALIDQGAVDMLRGSRQIVGHVTEDMTENRYQINGAIIFWCPSDRGGFDDSDREMVRDVAGQVGQAIRRLIADQVVVHQANRDQLTGLLNRRAVLQTIDRRLRRVSAAGGSGSLVFLDVDNLKVLNHAGGAAAGDQALVTLAEILRHATRPGDLIGRIGGDEFVIWLDGVGADAVSRRLDALLAACQPLTALSIDTKKPAGVSLGAAVFEAGTHTLSRLMEQADAAMYEAKRHGGRYILSAAPRAAALMEAEYGGIEQS